MGGTRLTHVLGVNHEYCISVLQADLSAASVLLTPCLRFDVGSERLPVAAQVFEFRLACLKFRQWNFAGTDASRTPGRERHFQTDTSYRISTTLTPWRRLGQRFGLTGSSESREEYSRDDILDWNYGSGEVCCRQTLPTSSHPERFLRTSITSRQILTVAAPT